MNRRAFLKNLSGLGASRIRRHRAAAISQPRIVGASQRHRRNNRPHNLPSALVDVTTSAGIHFHHNTGAYGGKFLPETLGSGCAFLDYDDDGWQDILLINGMDWPGHKRARSTLRLYRNNRNGTFTDVTRRAGLDIEMYGMGVAVGDYNNDGFPDIFITCVGQNRLFRNNTGKGALHRRHETSRPRRPPGLQHLRALVRLRSRRPARSLRLQLREMVA